MKKIESDHIKVNTAEKKRMKKNEKGSNAFYTTLY